MYVCTHVCALDGRGPNAAYVHSVDRLDRRPACLSFCRVPERGRGGRSGPPGLAESRDGPYATTGVESTFRRRLVTQQTVRSGATAPFFPAEYIYLNAAAAVVEQSISDPYGAVRRRDAGQERKIARHRTKQGTGGGKEGTEEKVWGILAPCLSVSACYLRRERHMYVHAQRVRDYTPKNRTEGEWMNGWTECCLFPRERERESESESGAISCSCCRRPPCIGAGQTVMSISRTSIMKQTRSYPTESEKCGVCR
jgi:hypothetical protein